DDDELNTILTALRFYQEAGMCDPANRTDFIQAIACQTDDDMSLNETGIDEFCERINLLS
ncbi:unnamed protein product, partial [Ectocarpus sp. 12 AP-2014]